MVLTCIPQLAPERLIDAPLVMTAMSFPVDIFPSMR
ncbi:hypothetical protein AciX8_0119 [Granulicella mallensis MP5ACTX8]|uniref:Uncharacterized protein n=1 Tax=Granulicella mallensis (strain ATCC BAA-1857 / DSM 23137 / MP5ACTX8) TaxID=682795 RepID=G8NYR4_GRAMM|nr:hypothetical protein AciX8_0119 [Granulicella mallensis MP5ACTX8]